MTFYGPQSCSLGGQGHSNDFPWASKLQFASLQRIQTSKIPNTFPNKHRPQQAPQIHSNDFLDAFKAALTEARATAMTFYGPQSCSLPACKGSKLPKFQTPSPTCTLGPRPLPQQAPQGQATAMAFLGFQSCRLPARKPSKTLQNSPNAPNPPKPAKPFKHRPQQAPQIHSNDFLWASKLPFASLQRIQTSKIPNTFPNMHPRAKATSPTGTPGPGHSNGFLRLSKLPFASPQTLQNSPKLSKPSSCRLPACKGSLQTLLNPPNPPNTVPSRHLRSTAMTFLMLSKLP